MRNGDIIELLYSGLTHWSRGNTISTIEECEKLIDTARLLISRLERLSADSIWAHRASGVRGALLRSIEKTEKQSNPECSTNAIEMKRLEQSVNRGFYILEKAAQELIQ
jgi:hypothetical protein